MKSMSRDQSIIDAVVPENETAFFKISPSTDASSDDWILNVVPNAGDGVSANDFRVVFAANDQLLSEQLKRISEQPSGGAEFELKNKALRICFSGRDIVLQCAPAERDAKLTALKDFCRIYARTEKLQKQVAELLKDAKNDTAFTGRVEPSQLPETERLSGKNRLAILARIEFAEIKREILRAEESSELLAELLEESGLEERVELLDDEIEIAEEVYAVCIDRLSEFSYFWREYQAELWIILILVVELIEFFFDLYLQMSGK